jgi:hypothetical protein
MTPTLRAHHWQKCFTATTQPQVDRDAVERLSVISVGGASPPAMLDPRYSAARRCGRTGCGRADHGASAFSWVTSPERHARAARFVARATVSPRKPDRDRPP